MPLDIDLARRMMAEPTAPRTFSYDSRDVILYALGLGFGDDPLDQDELPFVYERALKVLPTAATVLDRGLAQANQGLDRLGANRALALHAEQKVELHQPLAAQATLTIETRLAALVDKGSDKGAILTFEHVWRDVDRAPVATLASTIWARGDGGFGFSEGNPAPAPRAMPNRAPDREIAIKTRPGQALLYRLNGDGNALHADPDMARRAGFSMPILHGLCTFGVTCRAILQGFLGHDPGAMRGHAARFSAPVFPGETIMTRCWHEGSCIMFEADIAERPGVSVVRNGVCTLTTPMS